MQSQSMTELEQTVLQLPLDARIILLQTLALSLKQVSPKTKYCPPTELAGMGIEQEDIIHDSVPLSDWNLS